MRALLLTGLILSAPLLAYAQDDATLDFERGSFRLKNSSAVQSGLIHLSNKYLLVKQSASGSTTKYQWNEVASYWLGLQKFVRASGFLAKSPAGLSTQPANGEFVQLLASGAVSLMRYIHSGASGLITPGSSAPGKAVEVLYVLKRASEPSATTILCSMLGGAGKKFAKPCCLTAPTGLI